MSGRDKWIRHPAALERSSVSHVTTLINFTVDSTDSAGEHTHVVTVSSQRAVRPLDSAHRSQNQEDIWRVQGTWKNEQKRGHFFKITIPFLVCG